MTPEEFLALVESHPLPWSYYDKGEGCNIGLPAWGGDDSSKADVLVGGEAGALSDAAPALAAAAIRLLRAADAAERDGYPVLLPESVAALRAALPESLRS